MPVKAIAGLRVLRQIKASDKREIAALPPQGILAACRLCAVRATTSLRAATRKPRCSRPPAIGGSAAFEASLMRKR